MKREAKELRALSIFWRFTIGAIGQALSPLAAMIISTPRRKGLLFDAGRNTDTWDWSLLTLTLLLVRNQLRNSVRDQDPLFDK